MHGSNGTGCSCEKHKKLLEAISKHRETEPVSSAGLVLMFISKLYV